MNRCILKTPVGSAFFAPKPQIYHRRKPGAVSGMHECIPYGSRDKFRFLWG